MRFTALLFCVFACLDVAAGHNGEVTWPLISKLCVLANKEPSTYNLKISVNGKDVTEAFRTEAKKGKDPFQAFGYEDEAFQAMINLLGITGPPANKNGQPDEEATWTLASGTAVDVVVTRLPANMMGSLLEMQTRKPAETSLIYFFKLWGFSLDFTDSKETTEFKLKSDGTFDDDTPVIRPATSSFRSTHHGLPSATLNQINSILDKELTMLQAQ